MANGERNDSALPLEASSDQEIEVASGLDEISAKCKKPGYMSAEAKRKLKEELLPLPTSSARSSPPLPPPSPPPPPPTGNARRECRARLADAEQQRHLHLRAR
jgi:hypothetical protein